MYNAFHSFSELAGVPTFVHSIEKRQRMKYNLHRGELLILISHYKSTWNETFYFQALGSMLGLHQISSLRNKKVCVAKFMMGLGESPSLKSLLPNIVEERSSDPGSHLSSREVWCENLKVNCSMPTQTTITIIQRLKSRIILNIKFVKQALENLGWYVNIFLCAIDYP